LTILGPVGFEDVLWKLFEFPVVRYIGRVDEKRGKIYIFPPYTDDDYLRWNAQLMAVAAAIVLFLVAVVTISSIDVGCAAILLVIAIVCVTLVLLAPYRKYSMVIFQDRVEVYGRKYFHMNFIHLDVYPDIAVRRKNWEKGVSFDPCFVFVFTMDIGQRDAEEHIIVFCKEHEVPNYMNELRSYLPTMRGDFHRGHAPDGDLGLMGMYRTLKDLKKIKLK
jgi:hypothetical protein